MRVERIVIFTWQRWNEMPSRWGKTTKWGVWRFV